MLARYSGHWLFACIGASSVHWRTAIPLFPGDLRLKTMNERRSWPVQEKFLAHRTVSRETHVHQD